MKHLILTGLIMISALILASCDSSGTAIESSPLPFQANRTIAPACSFAIQDKSIYTHEIVKADAVSGVLIFGDMSPSEFEEAFPNRETGFQFPGSVTEVEVTAPGHLFIEKFDFTHFLPDYEEAFEFKKGQIDYGLSYWVCDEVWGELYHITGLSDAFIEALALRLSKTKTSLYGTEVSINNSTIACSLDQFNVDKNAATKAACLKAWLTVDGTERFYCSIANGIEKCHFDFTRESGEFLEVSGGTTLGTAAGFEGSVFHPGLDFNMIDLRHEWTFINPSRLGNSQEGRAISYLNAACPYEYFNNTNGYVSHLLSLAGNYYGKRNSIDAPCGTLNNDVANTAAGTWFYEYAIDELDQDETLNDLNLNDHHFAFHNNVLTLARDTVEPTTTMALSTPLTELVNVNGSSDLVRFIIQESGKNIAFDKMAPNTTYCLDGLTGPAQHQNRFLIAFANGPTPIDAELWLQPIATGCPIDPQIDKNIALRFVR